MFYYVYLLRSINYPDKLYIGSTPDLKKRVAKHNRAINLATRPYVPWRLIFYEAYLYEEDAVRREKYLKTSKWAKVIKNMLKEYFYHSQVTVKRYLASGRKIKLNF